VLSALVWVGFDGAEWNLGRSFNKESGDKVSNFGVGGSGPVGGLLLGGSFDRGIPLLVSGSLECRCVDLLFPASDNLECLAGDLPLLVSDNLDCLEGDLFTCSPCGAGGGAKLGGGRRGGGGMEILYEEK